MTLSGTIFRQVTSYLCNFSHQKREVSAVSGNLRSGFDKFHEEAAKLYPVRIYWTLSPTNYEINWCFKLE